MLKITWTRGPDLPQGFQDSDGGFIGDNLITVCGFCSGEDAPSKPGRYPRGFLKKAWGIDVTKEAEGWFALPDFPGDARQEVFAIPVNDQIYVWGGFSYSEPYCYKDGYRLSRNDGKWVWDELPPLPWPVCSSGICAIGSKIYVFGGADYDTEKFYTFTDRSGRNKRLGAHLLMIDTANLDAGWTQLADCPGTPRWVCAMAEVGGKIYVIGGATGNTFESATDFPYCTVVDNWVYNPATDKWTRLRDLPISSGNFPSGAIVFKERYMVLVGGFQYNKITNPDGTIRDKYGTPSKFGGTGDYFNDVFVYDTQTGLFGMADPLPINNNLPMTVLRGNQIYLIGGEADGREIDGVYYGHHPDLFLKGTIHELE